MRRFLKKESGQIGRFAVVGGICVATYYLIFIGLTEYFKVWYMISAVVAFAIYFAVQFLLQKFWAFRDQNKTHIKQQLLQFSVMAVGNWIINTTLLYLLVEYLHVWYVYAQVILTILVSIAAYFGYRWIFRLQNPHRSM